MPKWWETMPIHMRRWSVALLALGSLLVGLNAAFVQYVVAPQVGKAVVAAVADEFKKVYTRMDRQEDRIDSMNMQLAALRQQDVPDVAEKVDDISDDNAVAKVQSRASQDRTYRTLLVLSAKIDSMAIAQRRLEQRKR